MVITGMAATKAGETRLNIHVALVNECQDICNCVRKKAPNKDGIFCLQALTRVAAWFH